MTPVHHGSPSVSIVAEICLTWAKKRKDKRMRVNMDVSRSQVCSRAALARVRAGAKHEPGRIEVKQMAQQEAEIDAVASANQARFTLTEAQANRRDLIVTAPFDGTVITQS